MLDSLMVLSINREANPKYGGSGISRAIELVGHN